MQLFLLVTNESTQLKQLTIEVNPQFAQFIPQFPNHLQELRVQGLQFCVSGDRFPSRQHSPKSQPLRRMCCAPHPILNPLFPGANMQIIGHAAWPIVRPQYEPLYQQIPLHAHAYANAKLAWPLHSQTQS